MPQGVIIAELDGREGKRYTVSSVLVIGRAESCDITINDSAASRYHVEIVSETDGFAWRDLGSTNGTLHNGVLLDAGTLKHNDELRVGDTAFRFKIEEPGEDELDKGSTTMISGGLVKDSPALEKYDGVSTRPEDLLRAAYTVINEIASNYEPCALVDKILETTIKAIDAQRGALLFASEEDRKLQPCPVCHKIHMIQEGKLIHAGKLELKLSTTVAERVLKDGESILYQDSGENEDFSSAKSIIALNLRSIICVPIKGKSGIIGLLYMDTNVQGQRYTRDDLLLSTAVGNTAGLALENARMHTQMLEKQRTDQEIEHAWTIQQGFLVKDWPTGEKKFDVYGQTWPAKTVGGDFYDFVLLGDGRVGILIGDVSGKGVPAALTMAQLLAEFRLSARENQSPADVLQSLNIDLVARSQRGMFCTLSYAILELETGTLVCANAGHLPALIVNDKASEFFAEASGPPIGILSESSYDDVTTTLEPGSLVLLCSDGITEAKACLSSGPNIEIEFGMERLQALAKKNTAKTPKNLIDTVYWSIVGHCAPNVPHDDCTMIALRYLL